MDVFHKEDLKDVKRRENYSSRNRPAPRSFFDIYSHNRPATTLDNNRSAFLRSIDQTTQIFNDQSEIQFQDILLDTGHSQNLQRPLPPRKATPDNCVPLPIFSKVLLKDSFTFLFFVSEILHFLIFVFQIFTKTLPV